MPAKRRRDLLNQPAAAVCEAPEGVENPPTWCFRYKTGTAQPLADCKLLTCNDLLLAERVGFVPAILALINDLGLIGTARNRQNL
jgi:hypothetical protein